MSEEPRPYIAYLVRLWRAPGGGLPVWHASLEDPHTGERVGFASVEHLVAFLRAQTGDPGPDRTNPHGGLDVV